MVPLTGPSLSNKNKCAAQSRMFQVKKINRSITQLNSKLNLLTKRSSLMFTGYQTKFSQRRLCFLCCIIVQYMFILDFFVNSLLPHILLIIPNACEVPTILPCSLFLFRCCHLCIFYLLGKTKFDLFDNFYLVIDTYSCLFCLFHSFILETYIAPLQGTITQRRIFKYK